MSSLLRCRTKSNNRDRFQLWCRWCPRGCSPLGLSLRALNRYLPLRQESHVVAMKIFLTLFAVFGISAFTPTSVQSEQKISENDTFNSFWSGASQAGAGVICHAYKKGMIEVDQALDLIFNEYLVAVSYTHLTLPTILLV